MTIANCVRGCEVGDNVDHSSNYPTKVDAHPCTCVGGWTWTVLEWGEKRKKRDAGGNQTTQNTVTALNLNQRLFCRVFLYLHLHWICAEKYTPASIFRQQSQADERAALLAASFLSCLCQIWWFLRDYEMLRHLINVYKLFLTCFMP